MTKPSSTKPQRVKPTLASARRTLNQPSGSKGILGNRYLSTCKLCPDGVFDYQPKVWLTKPMGWSHEDCAQRAGLLSDPAVP
ncbi:hypothetical protein [Micromonospora sp. 4G55]|uniref:hypothetical protein n=1 Tax=Micromonospora sp. 4G55 TaxID=2806102 RepID=UPI001A55754B|nr:hypothetical protein [Micromonospora sp. 4G55]MBM0256356.1 hypothetical protein [Micromonospora sp. 4G55]